MITQRQLGPQGLQVGSIGYGAMGLEGYYGSTGETDALAAIQRAVAVGSTLIDTADAYGNGHNEEIVGRALKNRPEAVIATKFGIVFDAAESGTPAPTGWGFSLTVNGRPGYVQRALEGSLRRLGTDQIDLWYMHFPDPAVPIEETVGAMAQAVAQGKVRHLGLSNVSADQVRRAAAIHPIAAVQYEYSLWRREVETDLLPTLRDLDIALVPWSPLGAGFLTGTLDTLPSDDFRHNNPRFQKENYARNQHRFAPLIKLSQSLGITPAQLALAWLLHQGDDIVPIPGSRKTARIEENAKASTVALTADTLRQIEALAAPGLARGSTLIE